MSVLPMNLPVAPAGPGSSSAGADPRGAGDSGAGFGALVEQLLAGDPTTGASVGHEDAPGEGAEPGTGLGDPGSELAALNLPEGWLVVAMPALAATPVGGPSLEGVPGDVADGVTATSVAAPAGTTTASAAGPDTTTVAPAPTADPSAATGPLAPAAWVTATGQPTGSAADGGASGVPATGAFAGPAATESDAPHGSLAPVDAAPRHPAAVDGSEPSATPAIAASALTPAPGADEPATAGGGPQALAGQVTRDPAAARSEATPVAPPASPAGTTAAAPAPLAAAAATSTPTAPAGPARVTAQVFPEVSRLAATVSAGGTQRMTLQLQPEHLGDVRVVLVARPGEALRVDLVAGPEARAALADGSSELRRLLETIGAGDARIVVRDLQGGQSSHQSSHQSFHQSSHQSFQQASQQASQQAWQSASGQLPGQGEGAGQAAEDFTAAGDGHQGRREPRPGHGSADQHHRAAQTLSADRPVTGPRGAGLDVTV